MLNTCNIPIRNNMDRIIDHNGIRLFKKCQATGLLLVNGRLSNDSRKGQFTFCSHTGQSTVDFLMTNLCDFTTLTYFEVQDFNEYSDHAPILFKLHTKQCDNMHMQQETYAPNITRKIVWDENKVAYFKDRLANEHDVIQRLTDEAPAENIDRVINDFTRFMHDNALLLAKHIPINHILLNEINRIMIGLMKFASKHDMILKVREMLSIEPGTRNREPGTRNREQGTGNQEPGTGNQEPGTGNQEQGTGNREPGTGNRELT